jgi:MerR family transcriptional regulator, light-induced transcriptional regulator
MTTTLESAPPQARLRSGTAARLAGVPVATLRVWERRYAVVAAPKSATGQRLYSPQDVQRLRLMRQLTESGHAIGTLASLAHEQLQELHGALQPTPTGAVAPVPGRRVLLVGRSLEAKLQSLAGHQVLAVLDDLPAALAHAATPDGAATAVDMLVLHLPSLQPEDVQALTRLRACWPAAQTLLVYGFGTEALAEGLRAQGVTVQRQPVTGRDLARLLLTPPGGAVAGALGAVLPRRYTDTALAALAEMPSTVVCECPRHLAEIVTQLAGFERYSAQCLARNPSDAALHQRLSALAGAARTQFEQALADVAEAEGMEVPDA